MIIYIYLLMIFIASPASPTKIIRGKIYLPKMLMRLNIYRMMGRAFLNLNTSRKYLGNLLARMTTSSLKDAYSNMEADIILRI